MATTFGSVWPRLRRWHQLVLGLYLVMVVACASLVVGAVLTDRRIEDNPGRALATVTNVGTTRTTVEYQDSEGFYRAPKAGLLYPSGLGEGQRVWVTYAVDDPDLVKVEGRRWTLSVIPALSTWAAATLVAVLLWWVPDWQQAWSRRRGAGKFGGSAEGDS